MTPATIDLRLRPVATIIRQGAHSHVHRTVAARQGLIGARQPAAIARNAGNAAQAKVAVA